MVKTSLKQPLPIGLPVYGWDDLGSDLLKMQPGHQTGYKALDQYVRIPRGAITVVAARPTHGKTSFQLNLLINMLRTSDNKNSIFYFFTYEELRKTIATKLIMLMAEEVLDEKHNQKAYLSYLKEYYVGKKKRAKGGIKKAIEEFKSYTNIESPRLMIIDVPYKGEDLASYIGRLGQDKNTGAVFIDYIQKVSLAGRSPHMPRYIELKRVSELLLDEAKTVDIPVIVGAQLGRDKNSDVGEMKLHFLRESGDIEQDASVVLGLYRESLKNKKGAHDDYEPENLHVHILKNRGGPAGKKVTLGFDGRILQISDKTRF